MLHCALAAVLFAAAGFASPSPAVPTPTSAPTPPADTTAEDDPTSIVRTFTLQGTYSGATYGPGNLHASQIIPRFAAFRVGKSLLRVSLPRLQTINGIESGFGDMQVFYLFQHETRSGSAFVGVSAQLPTASSLLLGLEKWLIGPAAAYVFVYQPRHAIAGLLMQSAFSVAGPASSPAHSVITVLPFASLTIGRGWYLKWPEAPWAFDLNRGSTLIPVGLGIGRIMNVSGSTVLLSVSDETSAVHANAPNAPKNTVRLTITIFIRSAAPQ